MDSHCVGISRSLLTSKNDFFMDQKKSGGLVSGVFLPSGSPVPWTYRHPPCLPFTLWQKYRCIWRSPGKVCLHKLHDPEVGVK